MSIDGSPPLARRVNEMSWGQKHSWLADSKGINCLQCIFVRHALRTVAMVENRRDTDYIFSKGFE